MITISATSQNWKKNPRDELMSQMTLHTSMDWIYCGIQPIPWLVLEGASLQGFLRE
jgi:hypothetical protein